MGAERLGSKACAAAVKAGGKHTRVIKDDEIAGAEEVGKISKLAVNEAAACSG